MRSPDVLLIATPVISERESFYIPDFEIPLNVCYLAAELERRGIGVSIVDMNVAGHRFSLDDFTRELNPRIAGFAAYTPFVPVAHDYASRLKSLIPGLKTVVGGYHASALPEQTLLEFPSFDYLVAGEGENTLSELAVAIAGGLETNHINGLYYRENGSVTSNPPRELIKDIDSFPFPARHLLEQDKYKVNPINYVKLPTTGILASRGCNHRCTFCSQSVFHGRARVRSAANIIAEIEQCGKDFGIRGYRFYDDNLAASRDTCMSFCDLLMKKNIRINWNCFSRVDCVDAELLATMKRAGCHQIKFGVETGTEKMLDVMNKGITLEQSRRAVALTKKAGIECQISIILGLPGESESDIGETISFVKSLSPDLAGFNLFKPLPGSPLFKSLERGGLLLNRNWPDYSVKQTRSVVKNTLPDEKLEKLLGQAYLSFFLRPSYFLQRLKWFARYPARELLRLFVGLKYVSKNIFSKSRSN
jgi:anaerobic magnesium-protoporphyrin IX monomethyl ester cyclase